MKKWQLDSSSKVFHPRNSSVGFRLVVEFLTVFEVPVGCIGKVRDIVG